MDTVLLIINDINECRKLLDQISWDLLGCRVISTADHAVDGIMKVRQLAPSLVIIEQRLPDLPGMETIHYLRKWGYAGDFIFITSDESFAEALLAIRNNVKGFLVKPWKFEQMKAAVRRICTGRADDRRVYIEKRADSLEDQINAVRSRAWGCSQSIQKALVYIDTHLESELSLTTLCQAVSLSPSYFSRLFKKETGVSFTVWVQMVKMAEARRLLQNPANKARQVAKKLGYPNYSYFFQIYKKYIGTSPRANKK